MDNNHIDRALTAFECERYKKDRAFDRRREILSRVGTDEEIQAILDEYDYNFYKIAKIPELRDKVNRLGFDFDGASELAKNNPIEFIEEVS